ncbi:MAG: InlB B-repeat-containing protein, partial [Clostridia bacterium]|nr:InlB B-repeat-containing protein [Clostridia bacterium]
SGNIELVSKFIERLQEYTVTFDGEHSVKYHYGDLIEKPEDPTKDGFAFVCWCKGTLEWDFEKYTVTADIDLTAKWKKADGAQADSSTDESAGATDTNTDGGDEGCGSAIGASAVGLTLLVAAVLFIKKRED